MTSGQGIAGGLSQFSRWGLSQFSRSENGTVPFPNVEHDHRRRPNGGQARPLHGYCPLPSPLVPRPSSLVPLPSALCLLILLLAAGCRAKDINTIYGRRSGIGATSVNGTGVLAEMFERAGHKVLARTSLSPWLNENADCIVWFPDDFRGPSPQVQTWLERWLAEEPDRTLIYVGRDFDAAPRYWAKVQPLAPASQLAEIQRRKGAADLVVNERRARLREDEDCGWFKVDLKPAPRQVQSLQGEPEWLASVDPSKVEIELASRLVPPPEADVLLRSGSDALVSRQFVEDGQLIVVANGSFLLNLPLVSHEHRKLAGHLIEEIGPPPRTMVFLQSIAGGPPIRDNDPQPNPPSGLEILNVWPTNWILMHLLVAGVLFCFARYPIFGRPLEPKAVGRSDFGRHIEAVGQWLARSGDEEYAAKRLSGFQKIQEEG